ncbi:MAG: DUF4407 domain-containing protein [Blastocatellia bacterium]
MRKENDINSNLSVNDGLTSNTKNNSLQEFFWFCAGVDVQTLKKYSLEHSKYFGIGAMVFFTAVVATLSGGYALFTIFDSPILAIFLGLLWGLIIFNLDRTIVSGMRAGNNLDESKLTQIRSGLLTSIRLVIAIVLAVGIGKPVEVRLFEKEINQYFEKHSEFEEELRSKKDEIKTLNDEITKNQNNLKIADIAYAQGAYKIFTKNQKKRQVAESITNNQKEEIEIIRKRISNLQEQLSRVLVEKRTLELEVNKIKGLDKGFAGRLTVLEELSKQPATSKMGQVDIFISLIILLLETCPVLIKIISNSGSYEDALKSMERDEYILSNQNDVSTQFFAEVNKKLKEQKEDVAKEVVERWKTEFLQEFKSFSFSEEQQ